LLRLAAFRGVAGVLQLVNFPVAALIRIR